MNYPCKADKLDQTVVWHPNKSAEWKFAGGFLQGNKSFPIPPFLPLVHLYWELSHYILFGRRQKCQIIFKNAEAGLCKYI